MKIGWIGLGSIGCVMASNLIKAGYHLIMAGEAFMLGNRAGIDPKAFLEGIQER